MSGTQSFASPKREFRKLTSSQQTQLHRIKAVGAGYYPCDVILTTGEREERVYIVDANQYLRIWGIWPEEDKHKQAISIESVVEILDSPFRLPPHIAQKIYDAGESSMGYTLFVLEFNDGTSQSYTTGGAVDFVPMPPGKRMSDIKGVRLHSGCLDPNAMHGLSYFWCLYKQIGDLNLA